ncbi:MAG: hypothetical protein IPK46_06220 [Saprospiraceae bacterium]|nr:hypothetical protein [Saprospiraceae bacterium]
MADGFSFGSEENAVNLIPGIGFIHKTISEETMEKVVNGVKPYLDADRFKPKYNSYAATFYNTLNYKGFNWYVEPPLSDDVLILELKSRSLGRYYLRKTGV